MTTAESNVWHKVVANLQISLENMVVTYKTSTRVLLSIIEFLSFNRNQIPFVFETFSHMVAKWGQTDNATTIQVPCADAKDFALARQRESAQNTFTSFRNLSEILARIFKKYEIEQAVICFGATTFTLKEAFVVNMPRVSKRHLAQNHLDSPQTITRKVIMSIITSSQFFDANSSDLKTTNMFVFIRPTDVDAFVVEDQFEQRENFSLPHNCRTTILNIESGSGNLSLNCCRDLDIFSDGQNQFSSTNHSDADEGVDESIKEEQTIDDSVHIEIFFECKLFVKGFKDQLVKGNSVWKN